MARTISNLQHKKIKLSIQVSLGGLSFCGLNPERNAVIFLKNVDFGKKLNPVEVLEQIEKIYKEEDFLQNAQGEVSVIFSNELYTLVPEKYFSEESASDYLKLNTKILETDFVVQDHLQESNLINVFIPFTNINNYFFDKYGEFEYRHNISILVEEFLKAEEAQGKEETRVYLNGQDLGYDLVIIKNGKLLLANSFTCDTKEDFIYYLLFTAEQLNLDPKTFKLILLGNIAPDSDYYKIAYTYVKNIDFLKTSFGYIFDAGDTPPKGYQYFTLFKSIQ